MIHLYKIPDFYIAGFFGSFGSGKSLSAVESALDCANYFRQSIVSNIRLDQSNLRDFASKYGFSWFSKYGRCFYQPDTRNLIHQQNRIILFDEVGVHLFSRGFRDRSREEILNDLFTIRQFGNYLIYTAQGKEQVDFQLRQRTQCLAHCAGFARYDRSLGHSRLYLRKIFYFKPKAFEKFDEFGTNKIVYPLVASRFRFHFSLCGEREKRLFSSYHSFKPVLRLSPLRYLDGNSNIDYSFFDRGRIADSGPSSIESTATANSDAVKLDWLSSLTDSLN